MTTTWGQYIASSTLLETYPLRRVLLRAFGQDLRLNGKVEKLTFDRNDNVSQLVLFAVTDSHLIFCQVDRTIDNDGMHYAVATRTWLLRDIVSVETEDQFSDPRSNDDMHKAQFKFIFSSSSGLEPLTLSPAAFRADYNKDWLKEFDSFLTVLHKAVGFSTA